MREITSAKALKKAVRAGVVLIDFNASWCGPCRAQEPILAKLATLYNGRVDFAVINIDEHRDLTVLFKIKSVPTLVIFKGGGEARRLVGLQDFTSLAAAFDEVLTT
jgi:thioredoxin 1